MNEDYSLIATVSVYSVDRDEWSPCPDLNEARYYHSSCILGDKLYVSGGLVKIYETDSIEVADCTKLIDGSASW